MQRRKQRARLIPPCLPLSPATPGDTLIIPAGWAHAAATTSAAVLLGSSFLRRDALALQLEAWRIEAR